MKTEAFFKKIYENDKNYVQRIQITDVVWSDLAYYHLHNIMRFKKIDQDPEIQDLAEKIFFSAMNASKYKEEPHELEIKSYKNLFHVKNISQLPILKNQEIYFNDQIAIIRNPGYLDYQIRHLNPEILNYFDRVVNISNHQEMDLRIKFFKNNKHKEINKLFYSMLFFDQNAPIFIGGITIKTHKILQSLIFKTLKKDNDLKIIYSKLADLKKVLKIFIRDYSFETSKIKIAQKGLEIINKILLDVNHETTN